MAGYRIFLDLVTEERSSGKRTEWSSGSIIPEGVMSPNTVQAMTGAGLAEYVEDEKPKARRSGSGTGTDKDGGS